VKESFDLSAVFEVPQSSTAVDWMSEVVSSQQDRILELEEKNKALRSVVTASTSSSSLQVVFKEVRQEPPHILLVAGHTPESPGATFNELTEYELNYELLEEMAEQLEAAGYQVTTTHNESGYKPEFAEYFDRNEAGILDYRDRLKAAFDAEYPQGVVTNDTDHNYASDRGVVQLYGINLWANQEDVDAVLHIHFNDYPGRTKGSAGEHTGFSVFTPLKTNNHFIPSFELAKSLEQEMLEVSNRSTVPKESAGVLESELIAVGHANSTNMPALLLEGGFIYEEQFQDKAARLLLWEEYAEQITDAFDAYFTNN
jgi:N-acetylmuramoyl-L-alanine amidase